MRSKSVIDEIDFIRAGISDVGSLLPLVEGYHLFEGIEMSVETRHGAVEALLADPALGNIWLITKSGQAIGYIALCYGYSIEFAGRDAFIDEFYIRPEYRRLGIGSRTLDVVKTEAGKKGIKALHLEVGEENAAARLLYGRHGFNMRQNFRLMSAKLD